MVAVDETTAHIRFIVSDGIYTTTHPSEVSDIHAAPQVECPLLFGAVNKDWNVSRNSSKISRDKISGF
jgi:hypothetical protein